MHPCSIISEMEVKWKAQGLQYAILTDWSLRNLCCWKKTCQLLFIHVCFGFILKGRFSLLFFSSLTLLSCYFLVIEEKGVKMKLTVIDTPGFGDQINNENWWEQHLKLIIYNLYTMYTNTVESKSLRPQFKNMVFKISFKLGNKQKVLEL